MFWGYTTKDITLRNVLFMLISKGLVKNQIHMHI